MDESEHGFKWWLKHVIVPITVALIGAGAGVAYFHSKQEIVDFYASSESVQREDKHLVVTTGDGVEIHWAVRNAKGKLLLRIVTFSGGDAHEETVDIAQSGSFNFGCTDTMDFYLEETEGGGPTTLANFRVSPVIKLPTH